MGTSVCNNCREDDTVKELNFLYNGKPMNLFKQTERRQILNKAEDEFWQVVRNQLEYGNNPQVKSVEALHGPFQYNDKLNDNVPKITVNSLKLSNDATYYGQWYEHSLKIGIQRNKKGMDLE